MKLYKYKSLNNLFQVYDILINNRLHCSNIIDFNDPFEGFFVVKYLLEIQRTLRKENGCLIGTVRGIWEELSLLDPRVKIIVDAIEKKKVCSLSRTKNDVLLWAHYANGHRGIAIELDIPDDKVFKINYIANLAEIPLSPDSKNIEEKAMKAIKTKINSWKYENEYRIIEEDHSYLVPKAIKRVYCGYRIDNDLYLQMKNLFPNILFIKYQRNNKKPWLRIKAK